MLSRVSGKKVLIASYGRLFDDAPEKKHLLWNSMPDYQPQLSFPKTEKDDVGQVILRAGMPGLKPFEQTPKTKTTPFQHSRAYTEPTVPPTFPSSANLPSLQRAATDPAVSQFTQQIYPSRTYTAQAAEALIYPSPSQMYPSYPVAIPSTHHYYYPTVDASLWYAESANMVAYQPQKTSGPIIYSHPIFPESTKMVNYQPRERFHPMGGLSGEQRILSPGTTTRALAAGVDLNSNYLGRVTEFDIENANCPGHLNCALRITDIPPAATAQEIFDVIDQKVFSFSKNPPVRNVFPNCAARFVFMTRRAAEGFMAKACSRYGVRIRGQRLNVIWNRDRVLPRPFFELHQSRVIRIIGPEDDISAHSIENFLHQKIAFDLVDRKEWLVVGGKKIVELSFDSIRGQSRAAYKGYLDYIKDNMLQGKHAICWAPDPCDPSSHDFESNLVQWRSG